MVEDTLVPEVIRVALTDAEKVVKKQKTCAAKTSGTLYKLIHCLEACIDRIKNDPDAGLTPALAELVKEIEVLDPVSSISSDTKALHGAVAKLGKAVDNGFSMDVCGALKEPHLDRVLVDRVIAEHFYQEGAFEIGDAFVAEAGVKAGNALKAPYMSMYAILSDLHQHNLGSAIQWAESNVAFLRGPSGRPCALEFSLHRLAFLQLVQQEGQLPALRYARQHFPQFQATPHLRDVMRLMGSLCYARRMPTSSTEAMGVPLEAIKPAAYRDLFGQSLWEGLIRDFKRQCCALLGQAQHSPLLVTVSAGAAALPTLLKLASVVAKTRPTVELGQGEDHRELPVEVPLGREFVFHSIFACPVSREQSSSENPPMMLPCGHCICRHSIVRMAKSATRAFKCPYCPMEATMAQCMTLTFPNTIP